MTRADDALRLLAMEDAFDGTAAAIRRHPTHNGEHWLATFADELDTVSKARNNIVYCAFLSDDNLSAAVQIGEKLAEVAVVADLMSPYAGVDLLSPGVLRRITAPKVGHQGLPQEARPFRAGRNAVLIERSGGNIVG